MRFLALTLALLLCLDGFVSLSHDHRDGKKHPECAVCIFKSQKQVENETDIELKGLSFVHFHRQVREPDFVSVKELPQSPSARGPPPV